MPQGKLHKESFGTGSLIVTCWQAHTTCLNSSILTQHQSTTHSVKCTRNDCCDFHWMLISRVLATAEVTNSGATSGQRLYNAAIETHKFTRSRSEAFGHGSEWFQWSEPRNSKLSCTAPLKQGIELCLQRLVCPYCECKCVKNYFPTKFTTSVKIWQNRLREAISHFFYVYMKCLSYVMENAWILPCHTGQVVLKYDYSSHLREKKETCWFN